LDICYSVTQVVRQGSAMSSQRIPSEPPLRHTGPKAGFLHMPELRRNCKSNNHYQCEMLKINFEERVSSGDFSDYESKVFNREVKRLHQALRADNSLGKLPGHNWSGLKHPTDSCFLSPMTIRVRVEPVDCKPCGWRRQHGCEPQDGDDVIVTDRPAQGSRHPPSYATRIDARILCRRRLMQRSEMLRGI